MREALLDSASTMECNKEEAVRAKEIAEKKMQNKDYVGARRIALKAQQLYPELDNISQMLTVCEVHCSAEHKILHSEMDWYGILQITQTADEGSIKKQYRKLAFLLDPDKNKFTGAEAAFKLIGEAQRVLTDQKKRNLYDIKCKHCVRSAAPRQANQSTPSFPDGQQTFWTRRPFWEAYRNSFVRKQPGNQNNFTNTTSQQFTALNIHQQQQNQNPPSFPDGQLTFWTRCPFCGIKYKHYRNILNRALRCQSCTKTFIAYDLDAQGPVAGANCSQSASAQQKDVLCQGTKVGSQATVGNPPGVGTRRTFGTGTQEQQLFPKTGSTSDVGRDFKITEKRDGNVEMGVGKEGKGRPMNQEKPEELKPSGNIGKKRQRNLDEESSESFDSGSSTDMEEGGDNEESSGSFDNGSSTDMEEYGDNEESSESFDNGSCTDIEENGDNDDAFSSTPKGSREIGSYRATEKQNKVAASEGGLPRIHSPSKSDAASDVEKENPLEENLSSGKNENETCRENGKEADGYKMVFKAGMERGLTVTLEIPHTELLKFSHQFPTLRLTVEEKGSLRGSWELDPASLMRRGSFGGLSEAGVSTRQDDEEWHRVVDDSMTKNPSSAPALSSEHDEIPETEFYDFLTDKTSEKLRTGQIWAFYCDNDGMPKSYGEIKKIKPAPDFKVWVTWFEGCSLPEGSIEWTYEEGMPVCCGICESGNDTDELDSTSSFSHQLKASLIGKNRYAIHPSRGEVWALYKNWDAEWTVANLLDCKYDVVEILECNSLVTKVQVLVLADGYKTVFKAAKERQLTVTFEIPHTQLLRFSHQVPAFRLTAEKKGSLRGCWELDPAALPLPKICLN